MEQQHNQETGCPGKEGSDAVRYFAKAAASRMPLSVSFELTHRCNFRCVHCYLGSQEAIWQHRGQELDTDTIFRLLDELVAAGTLFLTLTGGDPMVRPDFVAIYEHAVRIGLLLSVYCNGSLLTDAVVAAFARYPPRLVEITVYGATQQTFEAITQKPGSYAACMEGIVRLRKEKVRLRLKTMVLTLNQHELADICNMVEEMGLQFRHDCSIIPALPNADNDGCTNCSDGGNALQGTLRFRLSPEQAAEADLSIAALRKELEKSAKKTVPASPSKKLHHCGAAKSSCHLTPYGNLRPCIITLLPSLNLPGTMTFQSGWKKMGELFAAQEAEFFCHACQDRNMCTGCPSSFFLETGYAEKVASFYCHYAACRREGIQ